MKILIVDDAQETRESLFMIIKAKIDERYEITEAKDGIEALEVIKNFQPDIVLTDIMMPKMDGFELIKILKSNKKTKHIFIAAITGLSAKEHIEKVYISGADFYIAKPFQLEDIIARLKVITSLVEHKNIITLKKKSSVYNCFNDKCIKHYFTTFSISQEEDIFLVFDYFSKQNIEYNSLILKDFIVALIKTYRKIDKSKRDFELIIEESEKYIYITIKEELFAKAILDLVVKYNTLIEYKMVNNVFSFRIDIVSFIDNKMKKKEEIIYQNEVVSANELMIIVSDDIDEYIDDVKEALKEYESFCTDNNKFSNALYLIIINLFDQYQKLFTKVPEFEIVFESIESLSSVIKEEKEHRFKESDNLRMLDNLASLNILIDEWIDEVIVNQESKDVHCYDVKIIDICSLIEEDFKGKK